MLIFEGVDFCFGSSGASNISKIKNPFDYIERGDDQLHAETLIAQFWSILIKIELSKHGKRFSVNSAKWIFDHLSLVVCHGLSFWAILIILIYVVEISVSYFPIILFFSSSNIQSARAMWRASHLKVDGSYILSSISQSKFHPLLKLKKKEWNIVLCFWYDAWLFSNSFDSQPKLQKYHQFYFLGGFKHKPKLHTLKSSKISKD